MNKIAIIFGSTGGIGTATKTIFLNEGYIVSSLTRDIIDFTDPQCDEKINNMLSVVSADVIINCAGYFGSNNETHHNVMDINVGSNWSIIKYYLDNPVVKPTKIIIVGSSAYKSGRKDYILYAASKAALYNLWQGACENFLYGNITLGLINPVKTRTEMMNTSTNIICLEPEDVAKTILNMSLSSSNQCIDMKYPEK